MNGMRAEQLNAWQGKLIDVRSLREYEAERLPNAECVPLDRIEEVAAGWDRNEPVCLMCKSGIRSKSAAKRLEKMGFTNVSSLEGGIGACRRAGLDVIRTKTALPIIRQVMIVSGVLLIAGLALSYLISPWFLALTWFVAIGTLNAGLTGYCPMARLLERMPWNAEPGCCSSNPASAQG